MEYVDIHCHILSSVDDGAQSDEEMYQLVDDMYQKGTRYICCTPHYHPGYYGYNKDQSEESFHKLEDYCRKHYPDIQLYLGNEIHYHQSSQDWVRNGECRTINNSRYLLIDFASNESIETIEHALYAFLRIGYIPILAHFERYEGFRHRYKRLIKLSDQGILLQANASSILKINQYPSLKKLMKKERVDLICSDTHNLSTRPSVMDQAYEEVVNKYSKDYANWLFNEHAMNILTK